MSDKQDRDEGIVGNIIQGETLEKPYLIACKCPLCRTVFTLEFSSKWRASKQVSLMRKCPGCGVDWLNWMDCRIPIWIYKLIRYSRERKNCKAPNEKEGV